MQHNAAPFDSYMHGHMCAQCFCKRSRGAVSGMLSAVLQAAGLACPQDSANTPVVHSLLMAVLQPIKQLDEDLARVLVLQVGGSNQMWMFKSNVKV